MAESDSELKMLSSEDIHMNLGTDPSVEKADNDMSHLFPLFVEKVKEVLAMVTHDTKGKHDVDHWIVFEGYRSQARQDWLYSQGRTRPGDVVTHIHVSNHTSRMAADCYPMNVHGEVMWEPHPDIWSQYGHCIRAVGMQWGGDYPRIFPGSHFVDQPHVEPPASIKAAWAAQVKDGEPHGV